MSSSERRAQTKVMRHGPEPTYPPRMPTMPADADRPSPPPSREDPSEEQLAAAHTLVCAIGRRDSYGHVDSLDTHYLATTLMEREAAARHEGAEAAERRIVEWLAALPGKPGPGWRESLIAAIERGDHRSRR